MKRIFALTAAAVLMSAGAAFADPIEGNWKTTSGETAVIAPCGGEFCIKLKTGKHAGKQIGKMSLNGANAYKGTITDPSEEKTYSGTGKLSGASLTMKGCVAAIFCKSQTWSKL
ncbi:DUF2147 domain-containing protein [Aquibium sp. ELW1220]|uniref:DUF2147 domain-containing protein n=1 Tax=Aquibium sp. ELW1220 TaxID=2976766 RepID=UPI0025B26469|nr:DUF2147 domain-containing protein [Aquibium sp. ELW1220]MDN2583498.1 DUF2147 domain-containing protein [Aquibium sp. ELW1220]